MVSKNRIRELMERRGISYRDLAFMTNLDAGHLCRLAHGKSKPGYESAVSIARALGTSPERVFGAK